MTVGNGNFEGGNPIGDRGRVLGGKARAARENQAPRDWPCAHCERMGYVSKSQCWGHRGFAKLMRDRPTALHSIREKVARTGRLDSAATWARVSS
jgi:hypothetical protein